MFVGRLCRDTNFQPAGAAATTFPASFALFAAGAAAVAAGALTTTTTLGRERGRNPVYTKDVFLYHETICDSVEVIYAVE